MKKFDDVSSPRILAVVEMLRTLGSDWWLKPDGKIRARSSNLDPLCELYRRKTTRYLPPSKFIEAGYHFGLTDEESLTLAQAADGDKGLTPLRVLLLATLIR